MAGAAQKLANAETTPRLDRMIYEGWMDKWIRYLGGRQVANLGSTEQPPSGLRVQARDDCPGVLVLPRPHTEYHRRILYDSSFSIIRHSDSRQDA